MSFCNRCAHPGSHQQKRAQKLCSTTLNRPFDRVEYFVRIIDMKYIEQFILLDY